MARELAMELGSTDAAQNPSGTTVPAEMTWISRFIARGAIVLGAVAGAGVVAMALATVYDVVMRYGFNMPTIWATEISTYLLVAIVFLGASMVHVLDGHIRVESLLEKATRQSRQGLLLASCWLAILFLAIVTWQMSILVISDYRNGVRIFSLLFTPGWLPKLPIAIGLAWLTATFLVESERLSAPAENRPTWLPYALVAAIVPIALLGGLHPPLISGTRFDWVSAAILLLVLSGAWVAGGWRVLLIVAVTSIVFAGSFYLGRVFGIGFVTAALFAAIGIILFMGVRIAFGLGVVAVFSVYFLTPIPFPISLAERAWNQLNSFSLTAVPLYVLMGALLIHSGLSNGLFGLLARALSWLPGGLGHAAIAGCSIFAAVSGSSVATAATIGSVACPEMERRGYNQRLTYGSVAAGGTLGILIPPSVPFIIYGITVGVPITTLFIAGIVPGLLLAGLFMGVIAFWSLMDPSAAPAVRGDLAPRVKWADAVDALIVIALIVLVIMSLYAGVATASETGAVAAMVAFLAALARGRVRMAGMTKAVRETVVVTSFIFLIVASANMLNYGFEYLKVADALMNAVATSNMDRWLVLFIILTLYVVLGTFLDELSMIVLTLPVVFPLMVSLGFDPVWFGVIVVITMQVGLITPPVGLNLFVLKGIAPKVPIREIFIGTLPFLGAMLLTLLLLSIFPDIALWLTRYLH